MQIKSLSSTVASLHQIIEQSASKGTEPANIADAAAQAQFPDPELAAEVYKLLQKQKVNVEALSQHDVSDAFLNLLLKSKDKGNKLAQPWILARQEIRKSSNVVGQAFADLAKTSDQLGFAYKPDIKELADNFSTDQATTHPAGDVLMQAWQNATQSDALPSLSDLVEFLNASQHIQELKESNPEISWASYASQAQGLKAHQNVGIALEELDS